MKRLQRATQTCFPSDDQLNPEAEAILVLVQTLVGELSQPITVVSGLSELLLSSHDQNCQLEKDVKTILKQTDRIKETLESIKYVTNYDPVALRRSCLI